MGEIYKIEIKITPSLFFCSSFNCKMYYYSSSNEIHLPLLIKNTLAEHSLPWNNLDQLSSLWAIFTKCKSNIQDGFRLENLSWRLWYRHSVLQKKQKPNTVADIDMTVKQHTLKRSRSLPNLNEPKLKSNRRKFYIDDHSQRQPQPQPQQQEIIKKKPLIRRSSTLPKPVSLLSEMFSRANASSTTDQTKSSGLRRCQSRYCRLDQFFLNAA